MESIPNDFIEDLKRIVNSILNQQEDLNVRWLHGVEKINNAEWSTVNYGVTVCTSTTRPTAYDGRPIYETDTNKFLIYDGLSWVASGGAGTDHSVLTNLNWAAAGHTIDADIIPITDSAYDLGDATHAFAALYCDKLTGYAADILLEKHLLPTTNSSHNLGSASYAFNKLYVYYLDGYTTNAQIDCLKNFDMNAHDIYNIDGLYLNAGATVYINADGSDNLDIILPSGKNIELLNSNKITGLGDPTANQDAATKKYVDDNAISNHSLLSNLAWSVAGHSIDADISPTSNQAYHLGSASNAFNTLFVDSLSNYTTDAQIECLKNFDMNAHDIYNIDGLYLNVGATMYLKDDGSNNLNVAIPVGNTLNLLTANIISNIGGLLPQVDSAEDIGSTSLAFNDLYVDRILGGTENDDAALDLDFRGDADHRIRYNGTAANELEYKTFLRHRFMIQATEILNIDSDELAMETGKKLGLNSVGGGTYIKDDASGNMELHIATGKSVKIVVG